MSTDDTNRGPGPTLGGEHSTPPDPTLAIPTESTSELPTASQVPTASEVPFRVEPDTPVRDDVPRTSDPHLPPPQHPAPVAAHGSAPTPAPLVTVAKGPRPGTVLLGLLTMVVSAWVLVVNLTGAQLDLERVGPLAIGGLGVLLLLIGLVGVVVGRRR